MHTRSNTQPIQVPTLVHFAGGRITGDNACHVRSVAVLVGGVEQVSVEKECIYTAFQIRVHRLAFAQVQSAIRDRDGYSLSIKAQLLHEQTTVRSFSRDDLARHSVK